MSPSGDEPRTRRTGSSIVPSITTTLTYTDNVDLTSNDAKKSDFIFLVNPSVRIDHETARTRAFGVVSMPIRFYGRTSDDDLVTPRIDLTGRAELAQRLLFLEGRASVQETYFNPFGARSDDVDNASGDKERTQSYRVTPILERLDGLIRYSLRDDNIWTNVDRSPLGSRRYYTNRLSGTIERFPTPLGWAVDLLRTQQDFRSEQRDQILQLVRLRALYRPQPELSLFVSGGYERNRLLLETKDGPTYGFGVAWRPDVRTSLDASYERRFFGPSYNFAFQHRMPLAAFSAHASRTITTYPEQLARLPVGTVVPLVLDQIFSSRIPDPSARLAFIIDYMEDRSLPIVLTEPLPIFSERIVLQELATAAVALLGVRNTLVFSINRSRTEPIGASGSSLLPIEDAINNNTQVGGGAVWSYRLTPVTTLTVSAAHSRTEARPPGEGRSDHSSIRATLTRTLSPMTTVFAGARHQKLDSNIVGDYTETAVFAGIRYTFR